MRSKEFNNQLALEWIPYSGRDFATMKDSVKTGYSYVLRQQHNMKLYLAFGECLEKAFYLYKANKAIIGAKPWKTWLMDEFKISESFARKLRIFYKEFKEYPRLSILCMSFYELYSLNNKLFELLLDPTISIYWKQL